VALAIVEADPQGDDALALLAEAAREARELYRQIPAHPALRPTNDPTPPRGLYLLGYEGGCAVASGALRPLGEEVAEVRRIYVTRSARRSGVAVCMLGALEAAARGLGYTSLRLETGWLQAAAMALYTRCGYVRIPPFGPYENDPTSVCFEKRITAERASA
jgi:GNAT superfamily N-acetyltransferase